MEVTIMTNMFFSRPDEGEVSEADNGLRVIGDTLFDVLRTWLIFVSTLAVIIVLIRVVAVPAFFLANLVS